MLFVCVTANKNLLPPVYVDLSFHGLIGIVVSGSHTHLKVGEKDVV